MKPTGQTLARPLCTRWRKRGPKKRIPDPTIILSFVHGKKSRKSAASFVLRKKKEKNRQETERTRTELELVCLKKSRTGCVCCRNKERFFFTEKQQEKIHNHVEKKRH